MNVRRFIATSLVVMVTGVGLLLLGIVAFPDHIVATDPPPTIWEYGFRCTMLVVAWPTLVIAELFGEPGGPAFFLLFIPSGLVWATLIELFFSAIRGRGAMRCSETGCPPPVAIQPPDGPGR